LTMDSVSEWLSEYAAQNIREFNPSLQVKYKPNTKITRDFKTHVMEFTLAINHADDSLSLTWVVVRPCAERHAALQPYSTPVSVTFLFTIAASAVRAT